MDRYAFRMIMDRYANVYSMPRSKKCILKFFSLKGNSTSRVISTRVFIIRSNGVEREIEDVGFRNEKE